MSFLSSPSPVVLTKSQDEIFGSAYAAAVYISTVLKLPKTSKVYVIGMSGLEQELASEGISFLGGTDPSDNPSLTPAPAMLDLSTFRKDPNVGAVLCGLDTAINYAKLCKAFQYLHDDPLEDRVKFLATNVDSTFPVKDGLLPGSGALTSVLSKALGREPLSLGKPGKTMMDCIKAK